MDGKQSLTQRDHEIVAIALTCLGNTDIDFKMLAEKGGYKNANSAREGYRVAKKKLLAVAGVDAGTGRILASKETHSTAASGSTTGTSARTQPARIQPARIQPARAAAARTPSARATPTMATSGKTVSTKAASAKTPSVRAKSARASSARTVPTKRGRRGAAASPSTSEEADSTSNDTEESDDEMEGDGEEDYKPSHTRRPLTKKAKTSAETKVSNNDTLETAGPEKLDEHGYNGDDEATVQDKEPEELDEHAYHGDDEATGYDKESLKEFNTVVPNLLTDSKDHGSMNDNGADEDAQAPDEKPEGVDNKGGGTVLTDDSEMHGAPVESESGKAADPVVLDDMAGILMQAAALEAEMKKNEES